QHGDGPVDEIHRRSSIECFLFKTTAGLNIVCNIRNVYTHFNVAVLELAKRQRVIKVLRVFGVNSERGYIAEVTSLLDLIWCNASVDSRSLRNDVLGKAEWEAEFGHDGVNLRFVFARFAENLDDLGFRTLVTFRPGRHLDNHLIARLRPVYIFRVNEKIDMNLFEVGLDEGKVARQFQSSHEAVPVALDDFNHLSFGMLAVPGRKDGHTNSVAVKGRSQVSRLDENVRLVRSNLHIGKP